MLFLYAIYPQSKVGIDIQTPRNHYLSKDVINIAYHLNKKISPDSSKTFSDSEKVYRIRAKLVETY